MIALQPLQVEAHSLVIKSILGLNPIVFFIIIGIIIASVGGYIFYLQWTKHRLDQARKLSQNKVLCEFTTTEGYAYQRLCVSRKGQIRSYIDPRTKKEVNLGDDEIVAPEGHNVKDSASNKLDVYFTLAECSYLIDWPEGRPKSQQIKLKKFYYKENDPLPKIKHGEEYSPKEEFIITARLAALAQEEKNMEVIVGELNKAFEKWEKILEQVKYIKFIMIGFFVLAFLTFGSIVISVMNMGNIGKLVTLVQAFSGMK
jgi:hypothetical protein